MGLNNSLPILFCWFLNVIITTGRVAADRMQNINSYSIMAPKPSSKYQGPYTIRIDKKRLRPLPGLDLVTADPPVKHLGLSSGPFESFLGVRGLGFRVRFRHLRV